MLLQNILHVDVVALHGRIGFNLNLALKAHTICIYTDIRFSIDKFN